MSYKGMVQTGEAAGEDVLGTALAIYPRRYLASIMASADPDLRVVPVHIRSLERRKR